MRVEILRYLSKFHSQKPLNEFLKTNIGDISLAELAKILREMSQNPLNSVIDLHGDSEILGKKYIPFTDKELEEHIKSDFGAFNLVHIESMDKNNPNITLATLDNIPLEAAINARGRHELEEYELRESIKKVNSSVIKTNNTTLVIASLAAVFSLFSIIAPLLKSDKLSVPEMQETNKILQRQVQQLDSLLGNHLKADSPYIRKK